MTLDPMYTELPPAQLQAPFALRPLSTGEALDRSFALFRSAFLLCVGVAIVPALLAVLRLAVYLVYLKLAHLSSATPQWSSPALIALSLVFTTLSVFAYSWACAGICWVASRRYLAKSASIREAYQVVLRNPFRYPAILLLQMLRAGWLTILLYVGSIVLIALAARNSRGTAAMAVVGGLAILLAGASVVLALYLYTRLSLALPAAVMEDLRIRESFRRSKALMLSRKGRVFAVLMLVGVLYLVLASALGFALVGFTRGGQFALQAIQALALLLNFFVTLLLQPLLMVALCVIYYDERVRRDGYDLIFLMEQGDPNGVAQIAVPGSAPVPLA